MFSFYVNLAPKGALKEVSFFKNLSNFFDVKLKSKDYLTLNECKDAAQKFLNAIIWELNSVSNNNFFIKFQQNPNIKDYFLNGEDENEEQIKEVGDLTKWNKNELVRFYLLNEDNRDVSNENNEVNYITHLIVAITFLNNDQTKGN